MEDEEKAASANYTRLTRICLYCHSAAAPAGQSKALAPDNRLGQVKKARRTVSRFSGFSVLRFDLV